jgi:predicted double-glycine peptidase
MTISTLGTTWDGFVDGVMLMATDDQKAIMRDIYYCGAAAVMALLTEAYSKGPGEATAAGEQLRIELAQFLVEKKASMAANKKEH